MTIYSLTTPIHSLQSVGRMEKSTKKEQGKDGKVEILLCDAMGS